MSAEVKIREDDEVIVAEVVGRIEGPGDAKSLQNALDGAVKPGAKAMLVDLGELAYVDSTGLRTIAFMINRTREAKMQLILCRANDAVRELLTLSGFDQLAETAETVEEAMWTIAR